MKTAIKKIKEVAKSLGVKIKVDKNLNKFSALVPDKMKDNEKILSNSNLNF